MNRTEVLEKMEPILDLSVRPIDHGPRTKVLVAPEGAAFRPGGGGRLLELDDSGFVGMTRFVGLPENVVNHLRPDTLQRVATELLYQRGRYDLLIREGKIVDFTKPREYHTLNPERVLRTIETNIASAEFHRVLTMPNHSVSLEILGDRRQPVAVGDLIQAGAMVAFSPIGTIEPLVQSYVLQLACTNGNVSNEVLRSFHFGGGGEGDNIWQWFRQSVRDAYHSVDHIVRRYQQMIDDEISPEDRAMVLTAMLKEAGITGKEAEAVRARAIQTPPRNSYEAMNLITWATSHVLRRPEQIHRAQTTAANFAFETAHRQICPVCRHER